jgi:hypothetical protein
MQVFYRIQSLRYQALVYAMAYKAADLISS